MTAGLQIWDESGNVVLDASYRVMRVSGSKQVIGGNGESITDDILLQGGWVSFQASGTKGDGYLSGGVIAPQFQINGNILSWSWAPKSSPQFDTYQEGIVFWGGS